MDRVMNPENPVFEELAYRIYDYLFEEFQVAPENERLHAVLYGEAFEENDYMRYRSVLEWFHFCSYVGFETGMSIGKPWKRYLRWISART